jgi:hypothetical protein
MRPATIRKTKHRSSLSRCLVLSTLLSGESAIAGDFRGADIGESCALIKEREIALGSREIRWKGELPEFIAFGGRAFERDVEIRYLCSNEGKLVTGDYVFYSTTVEYAFVVFDDLYAQLSNLYGEPVLDHAPWPADAASRYKYKGILLRTMTTWNSPRVSVTAGIIPLAEPAGRTKVLIIFSRPLKIP